MAEQDPILGIWHCDVCVLPQFWVSNKSESQPMEDNNMGKLTIQDETPENQALRLAHEAEMAKDEAGKEEARRANLAPKPMSEDTKTKLKELAESRKAMKAAIKAQFDTEGHPEARLVKGKSKVPVFNDLQKQAEICAKFSWCTNSFRQDPEKAGGTIVDIKCVDCGSLREVHLADVFHCKTCRGCKSKKKPKQTTQSE